MSKWEQEPKQHYRESPWAPFDLLGLFPLKSQLSKTFFFLNSVILLLEPSLQFQIHLPPTLPPSCSVIGGDSSLSAMRGPAHQSEFVVMPLQSDTGGPSVLIQPVWRRRGEGDEEGVTQGGTKLSPCSSRNIFSTALWQRDGFVWSPDLWAFLIQKQNIDKQGGLDFNRGLGDNSKIHYKSFY